MSTKEALEEVYIWSLDKGENRMVIKGSETHVLERSQCVLNISLDVLSHGHVFNLVYEPNDTPEGILGTLSIFQGSLPQKGVKLPR